MDNVPLQKYQDGELTVRYIGDERVDFFFGGEVILRKSMAQCEKLYPQYIWGTLRGHQSHIFIL